MSKVPSNASEAGHHPWLDGPISLQPTLIIAGGYRCGTTSLYTYLAGHPEVNPCTIKEPAFFFSIRLRERPPPYPQGHEVPAYLSMFRKKTGRVLLEATSNYLNDPGCAARILKAFPKAKIVLTLRDPVSRLVSWYKFLILQRQMKPGRSFEKWIREQLDDPRPAELRPYLLQALAHGCYSSYVNEFIEVFGRERVHLIWFDDLKRDQRAVMRSVCTFAGITDAYYDQYKFPTQNESIKIQRVRAYLAYRYLHRAAFKLLAPFPRINFRAKEWFYGHVEPAILGFFTGPSDPVVVSDALLAELHRYYRRDLAPLAVITGCAVPWQRIYE